MREQRKRQEDRRERSLAAAAQAEPHDVPSLDLVLSLDSLPPPDSFGNFWLMGSTAKGGMLMPAILAIKGQPHQKGKWMLSMGQPCRFSDGEGGRLSVPGGVLFTGIEIRAFDSPEEALDELRSQVKRERGT